MMYSRYLLEVLQDEAGADQVLTKLKNFYSMNIDRAKITTNINDFQNESTALISISAEDVFYFYIIIIRPNSVELLA